MSDYIPPYSVNDKMLILVSVIGEKLGRINGYDNLNGRPHLRRVTW